MSDIHITRLHRSGKSQAHAAACEIAADLEERYGVNSSWEGDQLSFTHTGVNGTIDVSDDEIEVKARLGFLVKPMKKPLEQAIHRYIDEHLSS